MTWPRASMAAALVGLATATATAPAGAQTESPVYTPNPTMTPSVSGGIAPSASFPGDGSAYSPGGQYSPVEQPKAPKALRLFGLKKKAVPQGHVHQSHVSSGSCVACEASAGSNPPMVARVPGGDLPGHAMVDGTPSSMSLGSQPMMMSASGAMVMPAEPVPVGVMQTNYNHGGQMMPSAMSSLPQGSSAMGMNMGMGMGMGGNGMPGPSADTWNTSSAASILSDSSPNIVSSPPSGRPKVLKHLFGLPTINLWRPNRARQTYLMRQRLEAMSAQARPLGELPASSVYQR